MYLSSVSPSRSRSHGPGPQKLPVLARLTYTQAIKKPRALFSRWKKVCQGGQTLELYDGGMKHSEGESAFDEKSPLRSRRCLDVFAESQTRHNEGKVYSMTVNRNWCLPKRLYLKKSKKKIKDEKYFVRGFP